MYSELETYWEDLMFFGEVTAWQTYWEGATASQRGRAAAPDTHCRKLITS